MLDQHLIPEWVERLKESNDLSYVDDIGVVGSMNEFLLGAILEGDPNSWISYLVDSWSRRYDIKFENPRAEILRVEDKIFIEMKIDYDGVTYTSFAFNVKQSYWPHFDGDY